MTFEGTYNTSPASMFWAEIKEVVSLPATFW